MKNTFMRKNGMFVLVVVLVFAIVGFTVYSKLEDTNSSNDDYSDSSSNSSSTSSHKTKNEKSYGVTSDSKEATRAGMEILKHGGNAEDAAIAVSYALGVTDVYGSGIGGGGMMLIDSPDKKPVLYDYQVTAPKYGQMNGPHNGIPGFVAGMKKVHKERGTMPMKKLIQPAIGLAKNGFTVHSPLYYRLKNAKKRMPVSKLPVFYPNGKPIEAGKTLKQKELAKTLKTIQHKGSDVFYDGEIAKKITSSVDGFEPRDFKAYNVKKRTPIKGHFKGYDVYSAGPPGGGLPVLQTLKLAEHENAVPEKDHPLAFVQKMGNINHRIYKDKIHNQGDPDFSHIDSQHLISDEHIKEMAKKMKEKPFPQTAKHATCKEDEPKNTTHFVVKDKDGTMVSATNTLGNFFGSGKHIAGMFLNSELSIFSDRKTSPNYHEPGKRPDTYIAPTILSKNGKPVMGIGSSGGDRIPSVMGQVLVRMLDKDKSPQEAVDAKRSFVKGKNGCTAIEQDYPNKDELVDKLKKKGYPYDKTNSNNNIKTYYGSVQTMRVRKNGDIVNGTDPRRRGHGETSK